MSIGGSLIGGSDSTSGEIISAIDMGAVRSATTSRAAPVRSSGLHPHAWQTGGRDHRRLAHRRPEARTAARFISAGDMGAVKIGHDVQGGSGTHSGSIRAAAATWPA